MTRYRLLAVDVDGTLLNPQDELTEPTRQALLRAGQSGLRVALVTGRRYRKALPYVEPLGLAAPVVTASGALIKHPQENHRTLFAADFGEETLSQWLRIVVEEGWEPLAHADTFDAGFDFYFRRQTRPRPELAEYLQANDALGRDCPDLLDAPPRGVFSGFVMGPREAMLELAGLLQERLPGKLSVHVARSPLYAGFMCEVAPAGADKWSGVRFLADAWEIQPEEICAVGDDVNDLPMIRGAGLGVAMGNARPEVKEAADRVAPPHTEDGLAEVVAWLMDMNHRSGD
ncbi:MAG: Cof-type HAD-IIB family hydrolase [Planctomycetales bacterium]